MVLNKRRVAAANSSIDLEGSIDVRQTAFVVFSHGCSSGLDRRKFITVEDSKMLETIAIILIVLWLFGLVTSYTMGGFLHILLVIAIVVILIRVIQGRRVV